MIKFEGIQVFGFEQAICGMRNPMNSHDNSDSEYDFFEGHCGCDGCPHADCNECLNDAECAVIGENDMTLMKKLVAAGTDHSKFMRMIAVWADITAPQFWWHEYDTYKVGTVRNSSSKMHKIHVKPFEYDDFTHEGIDAVGRPYKKHFEIYIDTLEKLRQRFNQTQDKQCWRALIEMLPEGYNMRATVMMNYQVLRNMYHARKNHKITEWHDFCEWIETLPYSELITMEA